MKSFDVGFILTSGYSSIAYVSAVEPLKICNQLAGEDCYRIENIGVDSKSVLSSLENQVSMGSTLADSEKKDLWFVVGAPPVSYQEQPILLEWLQKLPGSQQIGGISSGTYDLVRSGKLDGFRAVLHWWNPDEVMADFQSVIYLTDSFCIDKNRLSCRGGTASLDMMLLLIAQQQGVDIAEAVSQHFIHERMGQFAQAQITPLSKRAEIAQPILGEALKLMEANIEEPLTTDEISFHIKLSRRQLERLFKKHLNTVPSRYYLQIRMKQAREKLLTSQNSIADIGYSCGFSSGAHFSTAYRSLYGITPSEERKLKQKLLVNDNSSSM